MRTAKPKYANIIVEPLETPGGPACGTISVAAAVADFCRAEQPAILESSLPGRPYSRFTILACEPARVAEVGREASQWAGRTLEAYMQDVPPVAPRPGTINPGVGWIGYYAYEAGLALEPTLAALQRTGVRPVEPLARFGLYDSAAVYDHASEKWRLCAVEWPRGASIAAERAPVKSRLVALRARLMGASESKLATPNGLAIANDFERNMSYASYLTKVERAKRYIESGDIYQVNLAQRFTVRTEESPADIYARLRRINPSSHAAFLQWNRRTGSPTSMAVISSSPELFLDLHDGRVVTRPIKGTRPRIGDPVVDAAYRRELIESEKDRLLDFLKETEDLK